MTQALCLFGSHLNIVADHTTSGGQYDLIEGYFLPGTQTPPHRHTRYSEQLYVLEGEFTVWAAENKVVLKAGESFLISPCTPHVVAALGDRISNDAIQLSWNVAAGASAKGTLDCVPSWLTDFRDDLPRISVPTLIIQGEADRILPHHSTGARLPKLIKDSRLVVISCSSFKLGI